MRKVVTVVVPLNNQNVEIRITNCSTYKNERFILELLGSTFEISKNDMIAAVQNATNWEPGE